MLPRTLYGFALTLLLSITGTAHALLRSISVYRHPVTDEIVVLLGEMHFNQIPHTPAVVAEERCTVQCIDSLLQKLKERSIPTSVLLELEIRTLVEWGKKYSQKQTWTSAGTLEYFAARAYTQYCHDGCISYRAADLRPIRNADLFTIKNLIHQTKNKWQDTDFDKIKHKIVHAFYQKAHTNDKKNIFWQLSADTLLTEFEDTVNTIAKQQPLLKNRADKILELFGKIRFWLNVHRTDKFPFKSMYEAFATFVRHSNAKSLESLQNLLRQQTILFGNLGLLSTYICNHNPLTIIIMGNSHRTGIENFLVKEQGFQKIISTGTMNEWEQVYNFDSPQIGEEALAQIFNRIQHYVLTTLDAKTIVASLVAAVPCEHPQGE